MFEFDAGCSHCCKGCQNAYSKFEDNDPAPLVKIDENTFIMELFHGPTIAFKDVALTLLPYLLRTGADFCGIKEENKKRGDFPTLICKRLQY